MNVSALIAVSGLAAAAPLAVVQPDGWEEDRAGEAKIEAPPFQRARVFHPPGDSETMFIVESVVPTAGSPRQLQSDGVSSAMEQLFRANTTHVTHTFDDGVDEIVASFPDGRREHVRLASNRDQVLSGMCIGRDPAMRECEARLWTISLPVDPRDAPLDWSKPWLVLGAVVLACIAAVAFAMWRRGAVARKALRGSPSLVEHELVTITGFVRPLGETLEAALSGARCVAHRAHARVVVTQTAKLVGEPSETASAPFTLVTAHGDVHIAGDRLELAVAPEIVRPSPERERAFLARHGLARRDEHLIACDEIVIAPGNPISIRGVLQLVRDSGSADERGYRDDAPRRFELVSAGDDPVEVVKVF